MNGRNIALLSTSDAREYSYLFGNPIRKLAARVAFGWKIGDKLVELEEDLIRRSMTRTYFTVWKRWLQNEQDMEQDVFNYEEYYYTRHGWLENRKDLPQTGYGSWLGRARDRLRSLKHRNLYSSVVARNIYFAAASQHFGLCLKAGTLDATDDEKFCMNFLRIQTVKNTPEVASSPDNALVEPSSEVGHELVCMFALVAEAHHAKTGRLIEADEMPVFADMSKRYLLSMAHKTRSKQHPTLIGINECPDPFHLVYDEAGRLTYIKPRHFSDDEIRDVVKRYPELAGPCDLSGLFNIPPKALLRTGCPVVFASDEGNPRNSAVAMVIDMYLEDMARAIIQPDVNYYPIIMDTPFKRLPAPQVA